MSIQQSIGEKQRAFAVDAANLILFINQGGYECSFGEAFRSDEQAEINALGEAGRAHIADLIWTDYPLLAKKITNNGKADGIRDSLHQLGLALDLKLYLNGDYLRDSEPYRKFGVYWKSLREGNCWGGDFRDRLGRPKPDGGHFSREHEGRK
jgi:hypothetical protein